MPIREDMLRFADGSTAQWYVRMVGRVGCIFAVTPNRRVVLVHQYKHGARTVVTELPTGIVERGETAKAGAIRELREETGYAVRPAQTRLLATHHLSATGEEGTRSFFLATGAVRIGDPVENPHEAGEVELATFATVYRYARTGKIFEGSHVGMVYLALDALGYITASRSKR